MEIIGIGILFMIGIYLAPIAITIILAVIIVIGAGIQEIFRAIFGGKRR